MKTLGRSIRIGIMAAAIAIVAAGAALAAPNNTANVSCGDPTQNGGVTVKVTVKLGDVTQVITWNVAGILATDGPNEKAVKIRAAGPPADARINAPAGAANVVSVTAKAGWEIIGIEFAADTTNEKEAYNVFAAVPPSPYATSGLCSYAGTATGSGFVEVIAHGITAHVNVTNGMTAAQVEDQLVAALAGAGARLAGTDIATKFPGFQGDGRIVLIDRIDDATGLSVESKAPGITMDASGLILVSAVPAPGISPWGIILLALGLIAAGAVYMLRRPETHLA
jgi:hypothetical protein